MGLSVLLLTLHTSKRIFIRPFESRCLSGPSSCCPVLVVHCRHSSTSPRRFDNLNLEGLVSCFTSEQARQQLAGFYVPRQSPTIPPPVANYPCTFSFSPKECSRWLNTIYWSNPFRERRRLRVPLFPYHD